MPAMPDKKLSHKLDLQIAGCALLVVFWIVVLGIFMVLGLGG
jgi:hypothetical protein